MLEVGGQYLDEQLLDDEEFAAIIQDRGVAEQAYLMFVNRKWGHADGRHQMLSWRFAGGLSAEVRGQGEDYADYYLPFCRDGFAADPSIEATLKGLFERLGWTEVTSAPIED